MFATSSPDNYNDHFLQLDVATTVSDNHGVSSGVFYRRLHERRGEVRQGIGEQLSEPSSRVSRF